MKTSILFLGLALLGMTAASPLIIGAMVENNINESVDRFNGIPIYSASVNSYESGYLQSRAVVSIGIDMDMLAANLTPEERITMQPFIDTLTDGFPVTLDIRHGPVLNAPERFFGLFHTQAIWNDIALPDWLETVVTNAGDFTTSVSMGFGGTGEVLISASAFDYEDADARIDFGGIQFRSDLRNWGLQYTASGTINETTIETEEDSSSVIISPITLDMAGDLRDGFVAATGNFVFDFTGISVNSTGDTFNMEHMTMETDITSPDEESIDVNYAFGITLIEGSFMEEALRDVDVKFSLRNMDKAALRAMMDQYMALDFSQDPLALQQAMNELMAAVYSEAEYSLDNLSFQYGEDVTFQMAASMLIDESLFTNPGVAQNPLITMAAIDASVAMEFSQGFADLAFEQFLRNQLAGEEMNPEEIEQIVAMQKPQASMMFSQLVQAGTLVATGDGFSLEVSLADGDLLINGTPSNMPLF